MPKRGHVTTREIDHAADSQGIDRGIFRRLIKQESGGQLQVGSGAGAHGPAQLMPDTARALGVNINDPIDNLRGGAKYLRQQLDAFKGNYRLALAAYNSGPGNVHKYGGVPPFAETQHYVATILGGRSLTDQGKAAGARAERHGRAVGGGASSGMDRGTAQLVNSILGRSVTIPGADPVAGDSSGATLDAIRSLRQHDILGFASGINSAQAIDAGSSGDGSITIGGSQIPVPAAGGRGDKGKRGKDAKDPKVSGQLLELIHNDGGSGYGVKNGKVVNGPSVFSSVWAGHANHVHVAADPKSVVKLGKLAQRMGLHVGENPHFGGVTAVHVPGSYHYRGEAIDVSGDPKLMNRYAREVERTYGLR